MAGRHLVFVGPRGSGKTATGARAAALLGLPFADTDRAVEAAAGRTLEAIFAEEGEEGFRRRERDALEAALAGPDAVVAAGGGAVDWPESLALLRGAGCVVRLEARPLVLFRRIAADPSSAASRPPLTGLDPLQEVEVLARRRAPLYAAAAHATVDTEGKTPDEAAAEAAAIYRSWRAAR